MGLKVIKSNERVNKLATMTTWADSLAKIVAPPAKTVQKCFVFFGIDILWNK